MSKRIILVALLLAMVLVLPAAATIKPINIGNTTFIGESGLDISNVTGANNAIAYWSSGTTPGTDAPAKVIDVTAVKTSFYISPADFNGRTGTWYVWNGTAIVPGSYFYVDTSSLDVKVWNADTNKDASDKTVIRGGNVTVRVDSNLYPINGREFFASTDGFLTVKVKDATGFVYTQLFDPTGTGISLVNLPTIAGVMNSQWFIVGNTTPTPVWDTAYKQTAAASYFYAAGTYEIWVESNANGMKDNLGSVTGQTVSTHHTLTIADNQVTITANTDTVVRGNEFSVTVSGRPNGLYHLWVSGTFGQSATAPAPVIKSGQAGVTNGVGGAFVFESSGTTVAQDSQGVDQYANISLDDSGKRTVGFSTTSTTDDKTYTIRVADDTDFSIYDTVKVKVTKGAVTVDAEGAKTYYVGQDVKLFGENTDSDNVYLFITGPNLGANGAKLDNPAIDTINDDQSTFVVRVVKSDNTWDYTWSTASVPLDAGTYTIYAVSQAKDKAHISDAKYATVSVQLRKPFVNASLPSTRIAKGDEIDITGTAEGKPTQGVAIWILGVNKFDYSTTSVEDDNTFEHKISQGTTTDWAAGQYFVVVQHPMYNDRLDVVEQCAGTTCWAQNLVSNVTEFFLSGPNRLQGSDAAQALVTVLDEPTIDDTYTRLFFMLEEPFINIDAVPDQTVGAQFTLSGTTNLAAGDTLLVTITSSSFQPTQKTTGGEFSGVSGSATVVKGTGVDNTWSFPVDTTGFKPDQYIVTAEAIETGTTATSTFFVSEVPPTTVTTQPPATTTTVPATTTAPATTTVPPTTTPGFGAVIALIGLGAVAVLVLRRH